MSECCNIIISAHSDVHNYTAYEIKSSILCTRRIPSTEYPCHEKRALLFIFRLRCTRDQCCPVLLLPPTPLLPSPSLPSGAVTQTISFSQSTSTIQTHTHSHTRVPRAVACALCSVHCVVSYYYAGDAIFYLFKPKYLLRGSENEAERRKNGIMVEMKQSAKYDDFRVQFNSSTFLLSRRHAYFLLLLLSHRVLFSPSYSLRSSRLSLSLYIYIFLVEVLLSGAGS